MERLEINDQPDREIVGLHLARYQWATQYCEGKYVLDVACGTGYGAGMLAQAGTKGVLGIDVSISACRSALTHGMAAGFLVADAEELPLADATFDVIVSFETIEHLRRPGRFLSECSRVLVHSGILLISTPNGSMSYLPNPYHRFEYTFRGLTKALSEHFDILEVYGQSYQAVFPYIPRRILARLVHKIAQGSPLVSSWLEARRARRRSSREVELSGRLSTGAELRAFNPSKWDALPVYFCCLAVKKPHTTEG